MNYKSKLPQWNKYTSNSIWFYYWLSSYLTFFFSFSYGITDMSRVTAPSLSANNSQTWLSIHLLALLHVYVLIVRLVDQLQRQLAHEGLLWYYGIPGVVDFEQMLKLSINLSFFAMLNTFSWRPFCSSVKTRLWTFPLDCRNNLQGCIFLKEINQTA